MGEDQSQEPSKNNTDQTDSLGAQKFVIDLGSHRIQRVLAVFQLEVQRILTDQVKNDFIVSAVAAEGIIDDLELSTIKENNRQLHRTEGLRMAALVERFHNKPKATVESFLSILVNLPDNEHAAKQMQEVMIKKFPGSLLPSS